jgi:hypothetical protein
MTLRKKLLLALLLVVLLSQIPFAYRRYKLGRLRSQIQSLNSERDPAPSGTGFSEYQGVMHVHSFLGGHSKGGFEEIIAAAKSNQLSFVVMTEHTSGNFNTASMTLKGNHAGVLFVNGNEVSAANADRLLIVPGDETNVAEPRATGDLIAKNRSRGSLAFVAYPQEFKSWDDAFDGIEVYNVYTNTQAINPLVMFFDGVWSYRSYADLLFAHFYRRPDASLRKWDDLVNNERRLVAVAGNDAHANVGITVQDSSGQPWLGIQLDPYERSFRLVRVHVLIPEGETLGPETLVKALASGHCFIGFDLFGDTSGFSFTASNGTETRIQGDEIPLINEVRLQVRTPVAARAVMFKNGNRIEEKSGGKLQEFLVREKGSYRVEVYLSQLPSPVRDQPWIISNPIYVR